MPRVAVIGARGYTGAELLPLLHHHPAFEIVAVASGSAAGEAVTDHVPGMEGSELVFSDLQPADLASIEMDACVLALPNGAAAPYVEVIDNTRPDTVIVDLGADYRFDEGWVYGQPERFGERLEGARRIANPGCYATGAQLALAPLLGRLEGTPSVFGVSGFSGAGKKPSPKNDPERLRDNLMPYALVDHVHEREVSRHIGRQIRFLPHVAPFFRGISLSVSLTLAEPGGAAEVFALYEAYYADAPLVEIRRDIPEVGEARGRHGVIIGGFSISGQDPRQLSLVCVLDNLLKGAATQAIQNLNLAFGLDELAGIDVSGESAQ